MNTYSTTLLEKVMLTDTVVQLKFEKPADFSYTAGQFVQFEVPQEEKPIYRAYSLCSLPSDTSLEFCIHIVPGGKASTMFDNMTVGDTATFRGPLGHFVIKKDLPIMGIATGVGISPIFGMIRDALEQGKTTQQITLLFGVRHEKDIFWVERLEKLQEQYPDRFSFQITLSQPETTTWNGLTGRVTAHMHDTPATHDYLLCGSAPMVKDTRATLLDSGVPKEQVRFEIF